MSDSLRGVESAGASGLSAFSARQRGELTSAALFEREVSVFVSSRGSDGFGSFFDGDFSGDSAGFAQLAGDAALISSRGRVSLDELLRLIGDLPPRESGDAESSDPGAAILASLSDAPGSTLLGAILDLAA